MTSVQILKPQTSSGCETTIESLLHWSGEIIHRPYWAAVGETADSLHGFHKVVVWHVAAATGATETSHRIDPCIIPVPLFSFIQCVRESLSPIPEIGIIWVPKCPCHRCREGSSTDGFNHQGWRFHRLIQVPGVIAAVEWFCWPFFGLFIYQNW